MRSNVTEYDLVAPSSLGSALGMLASEPGRFTPLAGGTELMVALAAGRLPQREMLSLHGVWELRFIDFSAETIALGAATTFSDIRRSAEIARELPLLAQAASWTGSVANQNRGTIGGNLVNASPAADTPPALLVYEARVTLVSAGPSGEMSRRTIPYGEFHLGYKKTALRADELLYSVSVPRASGEYRGFIRKVGTRNAQAISKVALAGLARLSETAEGVTIRDVRLGAASLRETPMRCAATEDVLRGQVLSAAGLPALVERARAALAGEARPIDDIRSTAGYRAAVAGNLLEEFLRGLCPRDTPPPPILRS
ncbi:MAG: FAD binding domain-containing protein [Acidobacteriota bacterium]|nr:FAD binding domain-containing protein [Acidobacteriota bacterium]